MEDMPSLKETRPRLAVIGCGLQAEISQLPAILASDCADLILLIDTVLPAARHLAEKCPDACVTDDYRQAIGQVDAALLVLPNHLHAPIATDLLRHGIHVFVEKPMALNTRECDKMLEAATRGNALLAVGLDFRFTRSAQLAHQLLRGGFLGDILKFDLRIGNDLSTLSLKSDYLLRKETAGGGVLIDLGVHAVDLVLWWLGEWDRVEYYDDAMGGVESNCELHLKLRSRASGLIEVSRTRALRNTCILWGERGKLEVGLWTELGVFNVSINDQPVTLSAPGGELTEWWHDVFRRQFEDFIMAMCDHRQPFVPGQEGRQSIELIEECYAAPQPLPQPWVFPELSNTTAYGRLATGDRCSKSAERLSAVSLNIEHRTSNVEPSNNVCAPRSAISSSLRVL